MFQLCSRKASQGASRLSGGGDRLLGGRTWHGHTKAGFGLPKDTIEELGLKQFPWCLDALASTHVGDARYAGNETSQVLRDAFHAKLKFGKLRRAIEGWQKFCGR